MKLDKMEMSRKEKILGMFLGVGIGDALGMPVETFQADRIASTYGRVTQYLQPDGHKWFNGEPAGMWTDDTQLTLTVAEAVLEAGLDMDAQMRHHVQAMSVSTKGWGGTTKGAIRNVANGASWRTSGVSGPKMGKGNGPPMKISPLAATNFNLQEIFWFGTCLTLMTHPTEMGVSAALAQLTAAYYCLNRTPDTFDPDEFVTLLVRAVKLGKRLGNEVRVLPPEEDDLAVEFLKLSLCRDWSTQQVISEFGRGSCYCFHSLPFTYAFFLRNWRSVDCLYDVVSAGGDADTNGSMLGALLGALYGREVFPVELREGLLGRWKIMDVAERFAAKFA
jgi:ADP-ribosylglycohydrolase